MVEWTVDNFGTEGARDYLAMTTTKLIGTIREVVSDDERIAPDEDGESLLMPAIEILAILCERCGATPPRPATVKQWREKYLAAFDAGIDHMKPRAGFKAERRKVIERTFHWLESLSESYFQS